MRSRLDRNSHKQTTPTVCRLLKTARVACKCRPSLSDPEQHFARTTVQQRKMADSVSSAAQEKSAADADVTSSRASATKSQRENVEQSASSATLKKSDVAQAKTSEGGIVNEQDRSGDVQLSTDKRSWSSKTSISQVSFQCLQRVSVGKK